jgi:hypothetical protein
MAASVCKERGGTMDPVKNNPIKRARAPKHIQRIRQVYKFNQRFAMNVLSIAFYRLHFVQLRLRVLPAIGLGKVNAVRTTAGGVAVMKVPARLRGFVLLAWVHVNGSRINIVLRQQYSHIRMS